ncbi:MAG: aldehyde dehydrogenase family protein [Parvularculaceae bacterium]|nr:MAG: aldehyde dehydrogenase family protein [Parvularculaceae bacterium]
MLTKREFYIDGAWTAPARENDFEVINPSDEEVCAVISLGDQADLDAAVAAATRAFEPWAATPIAERIALVERIHALYVERFDEIAEAMSLEMGAPIDFSKASQADAGEWHIANFLDAVKKFKFERPLDGDAPDNRILYEPVGVCGLITPWNWPMNQVTLKVIPAMLTGCTMVLKPSEIAPLSSMAFAQIIHDAGTPAGVFNLVNGDGPGVGTQMSTHQDIHMISFTGSSRAGAAIAKDAADTHKRVHQELGGKGANIIFEDASDDAVKRGADHCFKNTGQSCNAPTRMLVHRNRYDDAIAQAKASAEETEIGLGLQPGDHIGPVVSQLQFDKIQAAIEKGIEEGARLVTGGPGRPDGFNRGYFVRPTVFADVNNDMTIAREEIFGPVLSIIPFSDEEEAIAIANDTPYGLTNYIQSENPERVERVSRRLRSGMVEANGADLGRGSPFGGMKASGNGREGGVWGLEDFLEVKAIAGWTPK